MERSIQPLVFCSQLEMEKEDLEAMRDMDEQIAEEFWTCFGTTIQILETLHDLAEKDETFPDDVSFRF